MARSSSLSELALFPALSGICALATVASVLAGSNEAALASGALGIASAAVGLVRMLRLRRQALTITRAMEHASAGDLDHRLVGWQGAGGLEELAIGFNRLQDRTEGFVREAKGALLAAARSEFHRRILPEGMGGDFERAADVIDSARETMARTHEELRGTDARILGDGVSLAIALADAATSNGKSLQELSQASTETEIVAAATHELAVSVATVAERCGHVAGMAEEAQRSASEGLEVVEGLIGDAARLGDAMLSASRGSTSLTDAVTEVERTASEISEVSHRTRMLALNAAVEAARAGETGRGFAVVAGEVKELAARTDALAGGIRTRLARLVGEIGELSASLASGEAMARDSMEKASNARERIGGISRGVVEAAEGIAMIAGLLEEQTEASREGAAANARICTRMRDARAAVEGNGSAVDAAASLGAELVDLSATRKVPGTDLLVAKSEHIALRKRLHDMLAGRVPVVVEGLSDASACGLALWFLSEEGRHWSETFEGKRVLGLHEDLHGLSADAGEAIRLGRTEESVALIDRTEECSAALCKAIDSLLAVVVAR